MEKTKHIITAYQLFFTLSAGRIVTSFSAATTGGVSLFSTESLIYLPWLFLLFGVCALPQGLLFRQNPNRTVLDCVTEQFGVGAGWLSAAVYLLFFLWESIMTAARFYTFAAHAVSQIPVLLFSVLVLSAAAYAASRGLEPICRIGVVIFGITLAAVCWITLTTVSQWNLSRLPAAQPTGQGLTTVLWQELSRTVELVAAAFLLPCAKGKRRPAFLTSAAIVVAVLEVTVFVCVDLLGVYASKLLFPFYEVMNVSDELMAFRMDAFITSIWTLAVFMKLSVLLYTLRQTFVHFTKGRFSNTAIWTSAAIAAVGAAVYKNNLGMQEWKGIEWISQYGVLVLGVFLPLLLLLGSIVRRRWRFSPPFQRRKTCGKGRAALLLVLPLMLTACSSGSVTQRLLFIECLAIDREDSKYRITVQAFSPTQGSPVGQEAGETPVSVISCTGESLSQAFQTLSLQTGKRPVYSKNRLIVLGEELLGVGMGSALDFLLRNDEVKSSVQVAAAKGDAGILLQADMNHNMIPAQEMILVLEQARKHSVGVSAKLLDLAAALENGSCVPLPVLQLVERHQSEQTPQEEKKSAGTSLEVCETALLKNGTLQRTWNTTLTRGYLLARGEFAHGVVLCNTSRSQQISVQVESMKTKQTATSMESGVTVTVECVGRIALLEESGYASVPLNDMARREVESSANAALRSSVESFLQAQSEAKEDWCDYSKTLQKGTPTLWEQMQNGTAPLQIKWQVFVDCTLTKTGQQTDLSSRRNP